MSTQQRFVLTRSAGGAVRPASPVAAVPVAAKSPESGCGCGGSSRPSAPNFPEVRVNGVEIEAEAIARELQHHPASDPVEAWTEAARALAVRQLLAEEADRLGVAAEPEADGGVLETREEALIRALLDQVLAPVSPDPTECLRYYEGQRERFRTPDLFEASHILIEPETDDAAGWAAAEARVRDLAARIGDSRPAFVQAARGHSSCPSAQQDGSLGQVRRGDLVPAVQAALEATAPGTNRREPVRSRFGWHLLRLERRIEGQTLPFELVHDRIRDMLEARAWAVAAGRYVADLASRAQVEGVDLTTPDESPCAAC